jgi:hypothetical protein
MKTPAKILLFGAGIAFLFKDQLMSLIWPAPSVEAATKPYVVKPGEQATPAVTPNNPSSPPPAAPGNPPPAPAGRGDRGSGDRPSVESLNTAEKVLAMTGPSATLSADQWNWYWSQASGVQQTADLFKPDNRGELISLKEYMVRRTVAGLSGLAVIGGRR